MIYVPVISYEPESIYICPSTSRPRTSRHGVRCFDSVLLPKWIRSRDSKLGGEGGIPAPFFTLSFFFFFKLSEFENSVRAGTLVLFPIYWNFFFERVGSWNFQIFNRELKTWENTTFIKGETGIQDHPKKLDRFVNDCTIRLREVCTDHSSFRSTLTLMSFVSGTIRQSVLWTTI